MMVTAAPAAQSPRAAANVYASAPPAWTPEEAENRPIRGAFIPAAPALEFFSQTSQTPFRSLATARTRHHAAALRKRADAPADIGQTSPAERDRVRDGCGDRE